MSQSTNRFLVCMLVLALLAPLLSALLQNLPTVTVSSDETASVRVSVEQDDGCTQLADDHADHDGTHCCGVLCFAAPTLGFRFQLDARPTYVPIEPLTRESVFIQLLFRPPLIA